MEEAREETGQMSGKPNQVCRLLRMLPIVFFLYFSTILTICDGNKWAQVPSLAGEAVAENTQNPSAWFQPFSGADWIGLSLTTLADFADMDSSYAAIEHSFSVYNSEPKYGQQVYCPPGIAGQCWIVSHRFKPSGEGNPLITGLFGTRYPTALDYTAFGALELAVQTGIAWVLPEKWRTGALGLFIGIGAADTVRNAYGGGLTFRF